LFHSGEQFIQVKSIRSKRMVRYDEVDKMLRVSDVAEILHVHPNTLRRWSEQGIIGAYRIGPRGDRRFRQSDIASFIAEFNPVKQNEH
jgi:excisionase family DNA binding protein